MDPFGIGFLCDASTSFCRRRYSEHIPSGCKLSGLEFKKNSLGLAHGQLLMKPKILSAKS